MKLPEECNSLAEVRDEIDRIDKQIIQLLAERFNYVKEVAKYKESSKESVVAQARYDQVMQKRREWAKEQSLDPDVIENVYTQLVQYFINEQLKIKEIHP